MNADRDPIDPALAALLREHSAETPSAEVDAAILAAAHRAVGSVPRVQDRAFARQAWRWWMPLAAAAVIGVVVIGVLPLAPTVVDDTSRVVTDAPAAPPPVSEPRAAAAAPSPKVARGHEPSMQDKRTEATAPASAMNKQSAVGALRDQSSAGGLRKSQGGNAEQLTPDAWIARIRALRAEGQQAEAMRELARFRDAFPDADARLPADLRAWVDQRR